MSRLDILKKHFEKSLSNPSDFEKVGLNESKDKDEIAQKYVSSKFKHFAKNGISDEELQKFVDDTNKKYGSNGLSLKSAKYSIENLKKRLNESLNESLVESITSNKEFKKSTPKLYIHSWMQNDNPIITVTDKHNSGFQIDGDEAVTNALKNVDFQNISGDTDLESIKKDCEEYITDEWELDESEKAILESYDEELNESTQKYKAKVDAKAKELLEKGIRVQDGQGGSEIFKIGNGKDKAHLSKTEAYKLAYEKLLQNGDIASNEKGYKAYLNESEIELTEAIWKFEKQKVDQSIRKVENISNADEASDVSDELYNIIGDEHFHRLLAELTRRNLQNDEFEDIKQKAVKRIRNIEVELGDKDLDDVNRLVESSDQQQKRKDFLKDNDWNQVWKRTNTDVKPTDILKFVHDDDGVEDSGFKGDYLFINGNLTASEVKKHYKKVSENEFINESENNLFEANHEGKLLTNAMYYAVKKQLKEKNLEPTEKHVINCMKLYAQEVGNTYTISEYSKMYDEANVDGKWGWKSINESEKSKLEEDIEDAKEALKEPGLSQRVINTLKNSIKILEEELSELNESIGDISLEEIEERKKQYIHPNMDLSHPDVKDKNFKTQDEMENLAIVESRADKLKAHFQMNESDKGFEGTDFKTYPADKKYHNPDQIYVKDKNSDVYFYLEQNNGKYHIDVINARNEYGETNKIPRYYEDRMPDKYKKAFIKAKKMYDSKFGKKLNESTTLNDKTAEEIKSAMSRQSLKNALAIFALYFPNGIDGEDLYDSGKDNAIGYINDRVNDFIDAEYMEFKDKDEHDGPIQFTSTGKKIISELKGRFHKTFKESEELNEAWGGGDYLGDDEIVHLSTDIKNKNIKDVAKIIFKKHPQGIMLIDEKDKRDWDKVHHDAYKHIQDRLEDMIDYDYMEYHGKDKDSYVFNARGKQVLKESEELNESERADTIKKMIGTPQDLVGLTGTDFGNEPGKIISASTVKNYKSLLKFDGSDWLHEKGWQKDYEMEDDDLLVAFELSDHNDETAVYVFGSDGVTLDKESIEKIKKRHQKMNESQTRSEKLAAYFNLNND